MDAAGRLAALLGQRGDLDGLRAWADALSLIQISANELLVSSDI